jgi:hypothetical protein
MKSFLYTLLFVFVFTHSLLSQALPPTPVLETDSLQNTPEGQGFKSFEVRFRVKSPAAYPSYGTTVQLSASSSFSNSYIIGEDEPFIQPLPGQNPGLFVRIKRESTFEGFNFSPYLLSDQRALGAQVFSIQLGDGNRTDIDTLLIEGVDRLMQAAPRVSIYTDSTDKVGTLLWESIDGRPSFRLSQQLVLDEPLLVSGLLTIYVELSAEVPSPWFLPLLFSQQQAIIEGGGDADADGLDDMGYGWPLDIGWNLVSTPIVARHDSAIAVGQLFDGVSLAEELAFSWSAKQQGFEALSRMKKGQGYWIYIDSSEFSHFSHYLPESLTADASNEAVLSYEFSHLSSEEYHLVGSAAGRSLVSTDQIDQDAVWTFYQGGYIGVGESSTIPAIQRQDGSVIFEPGRAYWVKANPDNREGKLALSADESMNRKRTPKQKSFSSSPMQASVESYYLQIKDVNQPATQWLNVGYSKDISAPPSPSTSFSARLDGDLLKAKNKEGVLSLTNTEAIYVHWFGEGDSTEKLQLTTEDGLHYVVEKGQRIRIDFARFGDHQVQYQWGTFTDVNQTSALPSRLSLSKNWPNPFNPTTTFSYELPRATYVQLALFDINGRKVMQFQQGFRAAGSYTQQVNASSLHSGIYFYQLKTPNGTLSRKMTLLK